MEKFCEYISQIQSSLQNFFAGSFLFAIHIANQQYIMESQIFIAGTYIC